ncbi:MULTISPECIES: flagellin [unclassified Lysinibacillus]|uniref:flagellin n=1 Tax=unclassified Lysinibacillus TaxID=2636778 RepID=UPI0009EC61AD
MTTSLNSLDNSTEILSNEHSKLVNRLEAAFNTNFNISENFQAAESQIRDTDMAKEMMLFIKNNIITKAS